MLYYRYIGDTTAPFDEAQLAKLVEIGADIKIHTGPPVAHVDATVLAFEGVMAADSTADGIIGDGVLYISNPEKINHADILIQRKRMSTPATTPVAEASLQALGGIPVTANKQVATEEVCPPSAPLGF